MKQLLIPVLMVIILAGQITVIRGEPLENGPYTPSRSTHDPITIMNSTQLQEVASLEGWEGNGSEEDPFIVENISIDGNRSSYCFTIYNCQEHIVIGNSTMENGGIWRYGNFYPGSLLVSGCRNISLENSLIDHMSIRYSEDISVDNISYGNDNGSRMILSNCKRVQVVQVVLGNHTSTVSHCGDTLIRNCSLQGEDALLDIYSGYWIDGDVVIRGSTFKDTRNGSLPEGLRLRSSYNTHLYENTFIDSFPSVSSSSDTSSIHTISLPPNNTVNGRPIRAYIGLDMKDSSIPGDSGYYLFLDSRNITLDDTTLPPGSVGIFISSSENIAMNDIDMPSDPMMGLKVSRSDDLILNGSFFRGGSTGLVLENMMDFTISNSSFLQCGKGMSIEYSSSGGNGASRISDCEFVDCDIGIECHDYDEVDLFDCRIVGDGVGLVLRRCFGWDVFNNMFKNCSGMAISVQSGSLNNHVYWNRFVDNNVANQTEKRQVEDLSDKTYWYHPGFEEGNLWNDHTSPDADRNGIVDDPYVIDEGIANDNYPLVSFPGIPLKTPGNFSIEVDDGEVTLSWDLPDKEGQTPVISGYRIYRNSSDNSSVKRIDIEPGRWSHRDASVVFGEEYQYQMTTYNKREESNPTETLSTFIFNKPGTISALNHSCNRTTVNLTWEPPSYDGGSPLLGYRIYRSLSPIAWTQVAETRDPGYLDGRIEIGQTYYYFITAFNVVGESVLSEPFEVHAFTIPDPPDLSVVSTGKDFIVIEWEGPEFIGGTEIEGYRIYRGRTEGSLSSIGYVGYLNGSFNDTSLVEGTTHFYYVTAVNSEGESVPSNIINVTVGMIRPDLPRPISPNATPGNGNVLITFDEPHMDEDLVFMSYRFYRREEGTGFSLIATSVGARFIDYLVDNGVRYEYYVTALYSSGESGPSEIVEATPEEDISPFGIPRDLEIFEGDGFVELSWKEPADGRNGSIISYHIYSGNDTGSAVRIETVDGSHLSAVIDELENGRTYRFYISARFFQGESVLAGPIEGHPFSTATPPRMPRNFTASMNGTGVLLKWEAPGDPLNGFRVYRSLTGEDPIRMADLGPDATEFLDPTIVEGESYRYHVRAYNDQGEGPGTVDVLFSIPIDDDGDEPGPEDDPDPWIYIVIGSAIILMLVVLVLVLFRRKDPSPAEE